MSSAILYLAIIAIWAAFLVPALIRRPHAASASSAHEGESRADADGELIVEYVTDTENDVEVSFEADIHVEVSRHEQEYGHEQQYGHETASYGGYAPHAETAGGAAGLRDAPSESREQMLRARRRILTILVAMTLATGGLNVLGLVQWWIWVPPAGMLVLYVLLLREIALADAEFARKRAAWEVHAARERAWDQQAEQEAYEASIADAGAQIIDISGRVLDQLYDQYADAAVRAVGD